MTTCTACTNDDHATCDTTVWVSQPGTDYAAHCDCWAAGHQLDDGQPGDDDLDDDVDWHLDRLEQRTVWRNR